MNGNWNEWNLEHSIQFDDLTATDMYSLSLCQKIYTQNFLQVGEKV